MTNSGPAQSATEPASRRHERGAPGGAERTRAIVRPPNVHTGDRILLANVIATVLFVASAVCATIFRSDTIGVVAVVIAVAMFFGGAALMAAALVFAAGKSRTHQLDIVSLFFPTRRVTAVRPQAILLLCLVAQIVAGIATAAIRPNTTVALGTLSWLAGLGFSGIWMAKHGTFSARAQ